MGEIQVSSSLGLIVRRSAQQIFDELLEYIWHAMLSKSRTYLIFGAPGSGKGTQGRTLGSLPGFYHCACGDVCRSIDTRTPLGQAFIEFSSKGQLVPDEITVELWQVSIQHSIESHQFKPEVDYLVLDVSRAIFIRLGCWIALLT